MKIKVNGIECDHSDIQAIADALLWKNNSSGGYSRIEYIECKPIFNRQYKITEELVYSGEIYPVQQRWTYYNWYREDIECTDPLPDGRPGRAYNAQKSYEYNAKEIINYINKDMCIILNSGLPQISEIHFQNVI